MVTKTIYSSYKGASSLSQNLLVTQMHTKDIFLTTREFHDREKKNSNFPSKPFVLLFDANTFFLERKEEIEVNFLDVEDFAFPWEKPSIQWK